MQITPIYDPAAKQRPMRVAAFMSGSGTNIIKLLEREKTLREKNGSSPFQVIFIFTDRSDGKCRGEKIALENGIPYFSYDIRAFHLLKAIKRTVLTPEGLAARKEYDGVVLRLVRAFDIDIIALGGYMSYTTLEGCINVHPADLSILTYDGKRKYVGDNAVLDAISEGEKELRASTILTDRGVDTGPLLMVSDPVKVILPESLEILKKDGNTFLEIVDKHQEKLKEVGDWKIFPHTIEMISRGRFALDSKNNVYVDGKPVSGGYRVQGT
ncbi:MAG: formyl transferase [Deltaproteobacteria bacterium]|nr:formyl transferase [Deltaproteobacteria bacterium]